MSGSSAQRGALLGALVEWCEKPELEVEWILDVGHSVVVTEAAGGFRSVLFTCAVPPGFTSLHAANAQVVGPARWVVAEGALGIRVDVPTNATRLRVSHSLSHVLELAGWPAKPLSPARRSERLAAGRRRLQRALERMGVDQHRLLRLQGGLVVGHSDGWGDAPSGLITEPDPGFSGDDADYCVFHLVEDRRGAVWLRASAVAGTATMQEVVEINAAPVPVMTRQLYVDTPDDDWHGDDEKRHVVAVADLDLSDVSPAALESLVWAVATFATGWRHEDWRVGPLPRIPVNALETTRSDEPLEVVDWNPEPVLLVSDPTASTRPELRSSRSRFPLDGIETAPDLHKEAGHDESCCFHAPRPARTVGACASCASALCEGGRTLLETFRALSVLTEIEAREIESALGHLTGSSRHRQAETRLAVKGAQRMPIRDLVDVDAGLAKRRLGELVGSDNPSHRVGCDIIDMLTIDGLNDGILLVGDAGCGKTSLAKHVAIVLDLPVHVVPLGSAAGRHTISGSDLGFKNPDRGAVVGGIVAYGTTQFLLVLDEIEKLAGHSGDPYPLGSVLAMLDDQRASFTDFFVGSEPGWQVDLTNTVFIATANDKTAIPESLLSRVRVIDMPAWTAQEKMDLAVREATRIGAELDLDQPVDADAVEFIVEACPEPGIRELLRALKRYEKAIIRSQTSGTDIELGKLFPLSAPTPVAAQLRRGPAPPGVSRSVVLTQRGWLELRCTATPNGVRWAGSIDALGADADTFVLHWVPILEAALGTSIPPCTLYLDLPSTRHIPTGLPLALLASVTSAVTGLALDHSVVAPLRADPQGRLTDWELSAADLAGLTSLGIDVVAVTATHQKRGFEWDRTDLPAMIVVKNLVDLMGVFIPGLAQWERPNIDNHRSGYL